MKGCVCLDNINLIKSAKKGDDNAFLALMDSQKSNLYKAAKAILHNDEDVADAMQETLISAYKSIINLKSEKYFKTWLTRILINKCYNIIAKNKKNVSTELVAEPYYEDINIENMGDSILDNVKKDYKVVLTLYYVMGFSVKEISKLLNIKEGTVKSRLSRGRQAVKKNYTNELKEAY